jgi:hypothetical protein
LARAGGQGLLLIGGIIVAAVFIVIPLLIGLDRLARW